MQVLGVSEVALLLQAQLHSHPLLGDVWIRGEASDVRRSPAGHWYFGLRDDAALLRCVLFRGQASRVAELPETGRAVVVHGGLDFYPPSGSLQLIADLIYPEGAGVQQLQFEALKLMLEAEGLFAPERKRPLPPFPCRIGLVTSDGGAVLHDVLTVLRRRYPIAEVVFAPCTVQGERAPGEITRALRMLSQFREGGQGVDVVILARGGGSSEDLSAFNDERVARAVFACGAPVVSAVGHETDFTIADLVADLRAPTPSAAAEMVAPEVRALRSDVRRLRLQAASELRRRVAELRSSIEVSRRYLLLKSPASQLELRRQAVLALARRNQVSAGEVITRLRHQVENRQFLLRALDPAHTLRRGYAICSSGAHRVVSDAGQVATGERLHVRLHRGEVEATVSTVRS